MNGGIGIDLDWKQVASEAAERFGTPCYLFSWNRVLQALDELRDLDRGVRVRHWLSFKSQPLRRLVAEWRSLDSGIEVVSEFELRAALAAGYAAESILVNGVGKQQWMTGLEVDGLRVNFDSIREVTHLASIARKRSWRVGLRCGVKGQTDCDEPHFKGQFGMSMAEVCTAMETLKRADVIPETAHFHLHSNIDTAVEYAEALADLALWCREAGFSPRFVDCGGGLPCPGDDPRRDARMAFDMAEFGDVLSSGIRAFPAVEEIWLENGRFITGRAGVLIIRVVDMKERPEGRYLICDGGRTNHALVSDWERHSLLVCPARGGSPRITTVCGPTCMAFDRLCRLELPVDVQIGDLLIWHNAGAYHIPWETRFSQGLATVVWIDSENQMAVVRNKETFGDWWLSH